jgi:hypothetical protein
MSQLQMLNNCEVFCHPDSQRSVIQSVSCSRIQSALSHPGSQILVSQSVSQSSSFRDPEGMSVFGENLRHFQCL